MSPARKLEKSPHLRIPIDPINNIYDLRLLVLVKKAEDAQVVKVGKRRLHKSALLDYAILGKKIDDVVNEGHLVGAQVAAVEEIGESGLGGGSLQPYDAADENTQRLFPVFAGVICFGAHFLPIEQYLFEGFQFTGG